MFQDFAVVRKLLAEADAVLRGPGIDRFINEVRSSASPAVGRPMAGEDLYMFIPWALTLHHRFNNTLSMLLRSEGHEHRLSEPTWTLDTWKERNVLEFREGAGRVRYSSPCFTTLTGARVNILVYDSLTTPQLWNCVPGASVCCPGLVVLSKPDAQAGAFSRDFVLVEWERHPTVKGSYTEHSSIMRTICVDLSTVSVSIGCNENSSPLSFAILSNSYLLWMREMANYLRPIQRRE